MIGGAQRHIETNRGIQRQAGAGSGSHWHDDTCIYIHKYTHVYTNIYTHIKASAATGRSKRIQAESYSVIQNAQRHGDG